jgi:hypothetical protein
MQEERMHAVASDNTVPKQEGPTCTVVYTTLYDLIAAVGDAIAPGEEDCVAPIVAHLIRSGHAQFLRDVDVEMPWDDPVLMCHDAEERCVPA